MSRMYATQRWKRRSRTQLAAHPLCVFCEREGRVTAAQVADHIEPHRGDPEKFWHGALQSLCKVCHASTKAMIELRGYDFGVGPDGFPYDPNHPFNKR